MLCYRVLTLADVVEKSVLCSNYFRFKIELSTCKHLSQKDKFFHFASRQGFFLSKQHGVAETLLIFVNALSVLAVVSARHKNFSVKTA